MCSLRWWNKNNACCLSFDDCWWHVLVFGLSSALGVDSLCLPIVGRRIVLPRLSKPACLPKSVTLAQGDSTWADGPSLPSLSSPGFSFSVATLSSPKRSSCPRSPVPPSCTVPPSPQSPVPHPLSQRREQPGRRKDSIQVPLHHRWNRAPLPTLTYNLRHLQRTGAQTSSRRFLGPRHCFRKGWGLSCKAACFRKNNLIGCRHWRWLLAPGRSDW